MLALSLIKLIEIIGEAASGLTPELRQQHANIPWQDTGFVEELNKRHKAKEASSLQPAVRFCPHCGARIDASAEKLGES
jgi:hypothetical protein